MKWPKVKYGLVQVCLCFLSLSPTLLIFSLWITPQEQFDKALHHHEYQKKSQDSCLQSRVDQLNPDWILCRPWPELGNADSELCDGTIEALNNLWTLPLSNAGRGWKRWIGSCQIQAKLSWSASNHLAQHQLKSALLTSVRITSSPSELMLICFVFLWVVVCLIWKCFCCFHSFDEVDPYISCWNDSFSQAINTWSGLACFFLLVLLPS